MSELIDNRAHRIRTLKEIIKKLHQGVPAEKVREQLKELIQMVESTEIAAMEQELIAEGMPVAEVQSMCDLHSQVLRELITEQKEQEVPPGHPVDTFHLENEALGKTIGQMRSILEKIGEPADDSEAAELLNELRKAFNDLMDVDKHYQRKENLLFSCLERHEISGPSKVMWGKDDEVRGLLKALGAALKDCPAEAKRLKKLLPPAEEVLDAVEEMISKEEKILLPISQETLTRDEWAEIWSQSPEYGWCLVEPRTGYTPSKKVAPEKTQDTKKEGAIFFPTGSFELDQLRAVFSNLPVDLTFVDAEDRVRFFSEGPKRVFSRSKAIIGRKVQNCHPPDSVHVVERIIDDFRSGRQNVAEFWIELKGRFIHIRYFALRDENGEYLGTLEATQDATDIRALTGERRLLQYESQQE